MSAKFSLLTVSKLQMYSRTYMYVVHVHIMYASVHVSTIVLESAANRYVVGGQNFTASRIAGCAFSYAPVRRVSFLRCFSACFLVLVATRFSGDICVCVFV